MVCTRRRRNFLAALVVEILLSSAAVVPAGVPDAVSGSNSWLTIAPGSDETQLCFSWATRAKHTAKVQVVAASGDTQTFAGTSSAASFDSASKVIPAGWYQNVVTVTGLTASSRYTYRVGDGTVWSDSHTLETRDAGTFSFIAAGDPQIGASGSAATDSLSWQKTVTVATSLVPNAGFLASVGDQINNTSSKARVDVEYDGYFGPAQLLSLPVSTLDGNHDYGLGHYQGFHYNRPNLSQNGATAYGNDGDYWFTYGPALFMALNSNTQGAAPHGLFLDSAIAKNPGAAWRIVMFHHSIYSVAEHATDADVVARRASYPSLFEKDSIDAVLSGHDHYYTRTYQMAGGLNVSRQGDSVVALNPRGILYVTLNSATGSKYYALNAAFGSALPAYSRVSWQRNDPTFSRVKITADTFSLVTYAINASGQAAPIDSYVIVKHGVAGARTNGSSRLGAAFGATLTSTGKMLVVAGLRGTEHLEVFKASGAKVLDLGTRVFSGDKRIFALKNILPQGVYTLRITGSHSGCALLVQP